MSPTSRNIASGLAAVAFIAIGLAGWCGVGLPAWPPASERPEPVLAAQPEPEPAKRPGDPIPKWVKTAKEKATWSRMSASEKAEANAQMRRLTDELKRMNKAEFCPACDSFYYPTGAACPTCGRKG